MTDVRALLKAKRQEARVSHPLASYSSSGQLRCIACGTLVRQAAAWNGHVGSKPHRINAAKLKKAEAEAELATEHEIAGSKRKLESLATEDGDEDEVMESKRTKVGNDGSRQIATASTLPHNFFSKPPPPSSDDDDDDIAPVRPPLAVDEEWERFQQAVLQPPPVDERRDAFENATIAAEPVLSHEVLEGFPQSLAQDQDTVGDSAIGLSEEELRRRHEHDERELIMDRLLDEERAQEEADAKVSMLKTQLDALKRKRELAKAARTKK